MKSIDFHIEGIKEGSEESFLFIYDQYERALYNHLLKMLGSSSIAEEVFQEVMVSIINKIDTYAHRSDLDNSFKAWIFRIATNLAIDEIRRRKKLSTIKQSQELNRELTHFDSVEEQSTKERINYHIQSLPLIQRTFLNLKVNEQMSLKEIALICKCEVNAVKQGLFRARKSMKELLIIEEIGI